MGNNETVLAPSQLTENNTPIMPISGFKNNEQADHVQSTIQTPNQIII